MPDLDHALLTRQHVARQLPIMRLSPKQQRRLLFLDYPVVSAVSASFGIDKETLADRMRGGP